MIETKDLVEFMKDRDWNLWGEGPRTEEYKREIVARLRELDKLKKDIKSGK